MVALKGGAISYQRGTPVCPAWRAAHVLLHWSGPFSSLMHETMEQVWYMGTSLIRKRPTPQEPPRILGMVLLKGPTGWRFLISEVPL